MFWCDNFKTTITPNNKTNQKHFGKINQTIVSIVILAKKGTPEADRTETQHKIHAMLSLGTFNIYTYCRAFRSGIGHLEPSRPGFVHATLHMRGQRSIATTLIIL